MIVYTKIYRGIARSKKGTAYPIKEWCFDFDGKKSEVTLENFGIVVSETPLHLETKAASITTEPEN